MNPKPNPAICPRTTARLSGAANRSLKSSSSLDSRESAATVRMLEMASEARWEASS